MDWNRTLTINPAPLRATKVGISLENIKDHAIDLGIVGAGGVLGYVLVGGAIGIVGGLAVGAAGVLVLNHFIFSEK